MARIRNSDQKVRFIKRPYRNELLRRFKALHRLYQRGVVLVDNMFILEECEDFYFYVIEAEIEPGKEGRFKRLVEYLQEQRDPAERKEIVGKIKVMLECLHQEGEPFAGLDLRRIIVDDEKQLYLAPFDLEL